MHILHQQQTGGRAEQLALSTDRLAWVCLFEAMSRSERCYNQGYLCL